MDTLTAGHIGGCITAYVSIELWINVQADLQIGPYQLHIGPSRLDRAAYNSMPYLDPYAVCPAAKCLASYESRLHICPRHKWLNKYVIVLVKQSLFPY